MIVKPPLPAIDWDNPISKKLVFDVPFFERSGTSYGELVKRRTLAAVSTPTWAKGFGGVGLSFDGSAQGAKIATPATGLTQNYTMEVLFSLITVQAAGEKVLMYIGSDAAGNGVALEVDAGKVEVLFRGQNLFDTTKTLVANKLYDVIISNNASTTSVYINGAFTGTTSNSATTAPTANTSFAQDDSNAKRVNATIFLGRVWERPLSLAEVRQLTLNPFQLYLTQPKTPFLKR